MIQIELSREDPWPDGFNWEALATRSALAALRATPHGEWIDQPVAIEISVRLTTDEDVQALNRDYRGKDAPTNVLSFPMVQPDLLDGLTNSDDGEVLLGDIALAYGVCAQEAEDRGIAVADHATHLIVHGVLHLLGYDHQEDAAAEAMEDIERTVLASIGLGDPYATDKEQASPI